MTKVKQLESLPIPEFVMGRLRKDGKPDRRYTLGFYMLREYLENVTGVSEIAMSLNKGGKGE